MNLQDYTKEIERTCPQLGTEFWDQLHMVIGICTEAGELLDTYKKALAYGKALDTVNIGEEMGDILWYLVNLCRMLKLDPEHIMQINIDKLKARYPERFTQEKALNRNLDRERKILEELYGKDPKDYTIDDVSEFAEGRIAD